MKKVLCGFMVSVILNLSADNGVVEPAIFADISEDAVENSAAFDGMRAVIGLGLVNLKFKASTEINPKETENKFDIFSAMVGAEYAKTFRNKMWIAMNAGVDVSPKKKKEGPWGDLNTSYVEVAAVRGDHGKIETDRITPFLTLKCGYWFRSYYSVAYLKFGINRQGVTYNYNLGGVNLHKIKANAFVPFIGIGFERKINSKWGAALECSVSIPKTVKKNCDNVNHKIKLTRNDLKIMATYSLSGN